MSTTGMNMLTSLYLVNGTDYNAVVISDAHINPEWNILLDTCRLS